VADVTTSVVRLGNPAGAAGYFNTSASPRLRVPDMQAHNGLIYIGSGDLEANVGPCKVIVLNPVDDSFSYGASLQTEEIDRFILTPSGDMVVPYVDPRGSVESQMWFGHLEGSAWVERGSAGVALNHQWAITTFDVAGTVYWVAAPSVNISGVGIVTAPYSSGAADKGLNGTWTTRFTGSVLEMYTEAFTFAGACYVHRSRQSSDTTNHTLIRSTDGTTWSALSSPSTKYADVFPSVGIGSPTYGRMYRGVAFAGQWIYLGSDIRVNYWWLPFGIYSMSASHVFTAHYTAAKPTTGSNHRPWDLKVFGGALYVLWSYTDGSGNTVVAVRRTSDLSSWSDELEFIPDDIGGGSQGQTEAQAFEYLDGRWYFGLGTILSSGLPNNVGDILAYDVGGSMTLAVKDASGATVNVASTTENSEQVPHHKSGGFTFVVRVEKTRPADTNAYAANDAIAESASAGTIWTFAVGRIATGTGTITVARVATDDSAAVVRYELDLYDDTITAINDNAEATRLYANEGKYLGTITFPAIVKPTTNSTKAEAVVAGLAMPFRCVGSSSIYGILRTLDADASPVSGAKVQVTLAGYQD